MGRDVWDKIIIETENNYFYMKARVRIWVGIKNATHKENVQFSIYQSSNNVVYVWNKVILHCISEKRHIRSEQSNDSLKRIFLS